MDKYRKHILFACGFDKQVENIENNKCSWCGSDKIKPDDFKDDLSRKEFEISGMCQTCQDDTFG